MTSPLINVGNSTIKDVDWVRTSFMFSVTKQNANKGRVNDDDIYWLYFSTAKYKYTNSSVGGNHYINPVPQFTIFADPPMGGIQDLGRNNSVTKDMMGGMGRYYSEAIDDWSQKVSFQFGVPEYKGLLTFFTGFYDAGAATLGRQGRLFDGLFYLAGRVLGGIVALPLTALLFVGEAVQWMMNRPTSRYYNLKETMYLYWKRVNLIANSLAANMGIVERNFLNDNDQKSQISKFFGDNGDDINDGPAPIDVRNEDTALSSYAYSEIQKVYPNLFYKSGGIDVFYIANKATRMQHHFVTTMRASIEKRSTASNQEIRNMIDNELSKTIWRDGVVPGQTLEQALAKYHKTRLGAAVFTRPDGSEIDFTVSDVVAARAKVKLKEGINGRTSINNTDISSGQLSGGVTGDVSTSNGATGTVNQGVISQSTTNASSQSRYDTVLGRTSVALENTNPALKNAGTIMSVFNELIGNKQDTKSPQVVNSTMTTIPPDYNAQATNTNEAQNAEDYADLLTKQVQNDNLIYSIWGQDDQTDSQGIPLLKIIGGWGKEWAEYALAQYNDGGQWINFRVEAVKSVTEQFTNNVGQSSIQDKINNMSSSMNDLRFSLSDLKTGFGVIDGIVDGVRSFFAGVADGLHVSGLMTLMGAGFVDIPQKWMDSAADLFPSATYTIKCRPPYGNTLSRYLNMHVPLACILAGCLPISYGKHSYGSPFICQFFVQGKHQSRLAMITSVTINRGEGSLGWTQDGEFLGCDIQFTVTDLSTIVHAPIDTGFDDILSFRWLISDDSGLNDYMCALSNTSVAEMTYGMEKLKRNLNKWWVTNQNFFTVSRTSMWLGDSKLGRMVRYLTPGQNLSIQ